MFNRFAAGCHRIYYYLIGGATILLSPLTMSDVGLPDYQPPIPETEQSSHMRGNEEQLFIRPISYASLFNAIHLRCDETTHGNKIQLIGATLLYEVPAEPVPAAEKRDGGYKIVNF